MKLGVETLGEGPDLLLIHGWGLNAGVWQPLISRLAEGCRLTLVDLPGHGASGYDPARATLDGIRAGLVA